MAGHPQDLLPEEATTPLGGPLGRRASESASSFAHLTGWLVGLSVVPVALSVAQKGHCVVHGWNADEQFWRACFSDLPAQYQLGGLSGGLTAYTQGATAIDQPVLAGGVMALLGGAVPMTDLLHQTRWYFAAWAVLATVLMMVTVWAVAATRPDRVRVAAQVALSPVVFLTVLLSADVLAVALVALAVLAWQRRWHLPAGILLGAGVLTRSYALVVILALVYAAWASGRLRDARRVLLGALATVVAFGIPVLSVMGREALTAYTAWWESPASYGSPWLVPALAGHALPVWTVTALAVLGWVAAVVLGWTFVRDSVRPPTVAQVALLLVAIVAVTGKTFPVQASLWLVPLVALAGVRWRDHLLWAAAEGLHFVAVWLYIGGLSHPDRALPASWYAVALLVRCAAVVWVATAPWRDLPTTRARRVPRPVDDDWELVAPNRYPVPVPDVGDPHQEGPDGTR